MGNFPYIKVIGDYWDIGTAIGTRMGDKIRQVIFQHEREVPDYHNLLQESKKYYTFTKSVFPHYIEEMEAIAAAANVPSEKYFFNNNREVYDVAEKYDHDHCTIAVSFNQNGAIIGHNEDWHISALDSLYVLHATVNGTTFLSLNYAGAIPGVAAGVNSWGLIQCINDLYQINKFGVPKNFLARAILGCHSLNEAIGLIKDTKKASGFNHVLVQNKQVINIEIAGDEVVVDPILTETYVHTNHYLSNLKQLEKFHTQSSQCRYDRAIQIIKPNMAVQNMKDLLSDTKDTDYPICRPEETIASLVFEPDRGVVYIAKGHPCQNSYEEYSL